MPAEHLPVPSKLSVLGNLAYTFEIHEFKHNLFISQLKFTILGLLK
jgi:hypothetical protein